MDPLQLEKFIIRVLKTMGKYSPEAVDLLMVTAAQESHCGEYIYQLGRGPARGIFQMEPSTLDDIFTNYLAYRPELARMVEQFQSQDLDFDLEGNLLFQVAIARVHYMRVPAAIPKRLIPVQEYIQALAEYWKKYWNTKEGAGTVVEAVDNYKRYVVQKKRK